MKARIRAELAEMVDDIGYGWSTTLLSLLSVAVLLLAAAVLLVMVETMPLGPAVMAVAAWGWWSVRRLLKRIVP